MEKCLHILPMNKVSGAEKLVLLLCRNMNEYSSIVVCGGEQLQKVFLDNKIESYAINFSRITLILQLIKLKKLMLKNNIKIIHAHDNKASIIAYLLKKISNNNIKIISHIHNCYPFLKSENMYRKLDGLLRSKYDYSIACGKVVYDFYSENSKFFDKNRLIIISNSMDINEIEKGKYNKINDITNKYKIPKDKTIIGFIGRLEEQKGLIPFIKEVSKYKVKFSDCKFVLIGNGSLEKEIRGFINKLGLNDMFYLLGYQENVYDFYPIIDIFFLPSLYEGLPMVLLEAMTFKKSIISMDVGSISEVIKDNKTGFLIDDQNYEEFIKKLIFLKENQEIRERLGNESYNFIKDNFNIKAYVNKVESLYNKLILEG